MVSVPYLTYLTTMARTQADRQSTSAGVWRPSRELATVVALCLVGEPNYAQFGNRVHAGRAYLRAEADHANGVDNLLMGRGGLERRDEPGRAVSGADSTARVKTGGRGTSRGEATGGEGKEQSTVRPDSPTAIEEDRGRRLGSSV
mgnify:CR=1 FL=1